jgi:VWFA-related protein
MPRAIILAVALALWSPAPDAQQRPFVERVEVARVLIDARVFDDRGRPVANLDASDFAVKIDGAPARVESSEWIGTAPVAAPTSPPSRTSRGTAAEPSPPSMAPGASRLVVFLVQKDLEPLRIRGLMQMSQLVDTLLQPLTRDDRVAVLSFDSRLRIWTDWTNDVEQVRSILAEDVIVRLPLEVTPSEDASLMTALNQRSGGRIFSIEHALRHIAESLEPLPGAKSLILLGYGFGRFGSGGVILMDGYDEASAALQRARVSVFTLNVTQAHYNSLQVGLQSVSEETGGLYASTYEFPALAIERVGRALAGYYVLFVEKPDVRKGVHRIEVRLTGRRGTVIARSSYVDD